MMREEEEDEQNKSKNEIIRISTLLSSSEQEKEVFRKKIEEMGGEMERVRKGAVRMNEADERAQIGRTRGRDWIWY